MNTLNNLNTNSNLKITAPYSIIANTNFTSDLDIYRYNNLNLYLTDSSNPDFITIQIFKTEKDINTNKVSSTYTLPWWSKDAPSILRKLDFSSVNGEAVAYHIDANHTLTLLPHQGWWGKVYVLEERGQDGVAKIICAVKVLLTKFDNHEEDFHLRHKTEIQNNIIATNFDIAVKTYGILEQDPDHYLMFLEYGESAKDRFANQSLDITVKDLNNFIIKLNRMHAEGFVHGDLNLGNLLYIDNKLKLCDWFSLTEIKNVSVNEYRYYGDNLPPEALRAFYYDKILKSAKLDMKYAIEQDQYKHHVYWLHPIAADRFCLGVSLMEIIFPDLYKSIEREPFSKSFNPYSPTSLEFWPKYSATIKKMQYTMLQRIQRMNIQKSQEAKLINQIVRFIDLNPLQREIFNINIEY